jgi:hypothetical protein
VLLLPKVLDGVEGTDFGERGECAGTSSGTSYTHKQPHHDLRLHYALHKNLAYHVLCQSRMTKHDWGMSYRVVGQWMPTSDSPTSTLDYSLSPIAPSDLRKAALQRDVDNDILRPPKTAIERHDNKAQYRGCPRRRAAIDMRVRRQFGATNNACIQ